MSMDHQHIEQSNIVERYVMGKLASEEQSLFEDHFLDCRECLDRIEMTEGLRSGLRGMAAEDATRLIARAGLVGWLARVSRRRRVMLRCCSSHLPTAFFLWRIEETRSELAEARQSLEELQQRRESEQEAHSRELRQTQQQPAGLESQPERERRSRAAAPEELKKLKKPQVASNPAVFILSAVRGGEPTAEPANRVTLSSRVIVLSLEMDDASEFESYRATLTDSGSRIVWSAANLSSSSKDLLAVRIRSSLLREGVYVLTLEGRSSTGRYERVSRYSFRATRKAGK